MRKCLIAIIAVLCAALPAYADHHDEAWETYIKAHKQAQVAFHHEVRLTLHELRDLIELSQEMQIRTAEQRTRQYYYLLENFPARITRNQGFSAFINFDWTEADESALKESDEDYKKEQKKLKKLKRKVEKDPDFQLILEQLEKINGSIEYDRIRNRFRFMPEEVERYLNA